MSGKRKSNKKQQIIDSGVKLFTKYGARKVTVEEICMEAGTSKMTFYKYFRNKTELVIHIKREWTDEGFKKFDEIKNLKIPFMEKIQLMTNWKVEFASKIGSEFIRDLIGIEDEVEQMKARYLQNISDARDDGEIRKDIDLEFLWTVLAKINELYKEEIWRKLNINIGEFQRQLRTLIYYGLLTRSEPEK